MREDKQDIRQRAAAAGSMCASTTLAHHRGEWCGAHTKPFTSSKGGDVEPRAAVASSSGRLPSARLPSAWCAYATASGVEREPTNVVEQRENQPGPHEEKPTLGTVPAGDAGHDARVGRAKAQQHDWLLLLRLPALEIIVY